MLNFCCPQACEVCGELATVQVQDVKEHKPAGGFTVHVVDGPVHHLCEEHKREGAIHELSSKE